MGCGQLRQRPGHCGSRRGNTPSASSSERDAMAAAQEHQAVNESLGTGERSLTAAMRHRVLLHTRAMPHAVRKLTYLRGISTH